MAVLKRCRSLVGTFKHSSTLAAELRTVLLEQATNNRETGSIPTRLKQEVPTRWNSTLAMLLSLRICENGLRVVLNRERHAKHKSQLLYSHDYEIIDELIKVLNPFQAATKLMSASSYVTSSVILPATTLLLEILQISSRSSRFGSVNAMCLSMHDQLNELAAPYFQNVVLTTATFLDPR